MLLFPDLTAQDFIGPYDVFVRASEYLEVLVVSENTEIIRAEGGLQLKANLSLDQCPTVDILFVPGGRGVNDVMMNKKYVEFLQAQSHHAKYITSVCTGSLVLAAAGLLNGFNATTHWRSLELLKMFSRVKVKEERVVIDGTRITGGGVTAGIDFGLTLLAHLFGEDLAKTIQLSLEYDPQPPFQSGSPKKADRNVFEKARTISEAIFNQRQAIIQKLLLDKPRASQ